MTIISQAAEAMQPVLTPGSDAAAQAAPSLLRFNGAPIDDRRGMVLPDAVAPVWRGCGGNTNPTRRLRSTWDLLTGSFASLTLTDATSWSLQCLPGGNTAAWPLASGGFRLFFTR
jgi:hypothetical protein